MALTPEQLQILHDDIESNPVMAAYPETGDGAFAIASMYNLTAVPNFTVWKPNVSIGDVGDNIVATDLAGLTTANTTRLQAVVLLSPNGINPSLPDRRAFFDDIFSGAGGSATRTKLAALWRRLATRSEKLFATGVGTEASPATMTVVGLLDYHDVQDARALS